MLAAVEWTLVGSVDGTQILVLIGIYTDRIGDQHWSTMTEIRQRIKDSAVTSPLSDRELRAQRRDFRTKITDDGMDDTKTSEVKFDTAARSLLTACADSYLLNEIVQRAVSLGAKYDTRCLTALPIPRSNRRSLSRSHLLLSPVSPSINGRRTERASSIPLRNASWLMQKCAESLKENLPASLHKWRNVCHHNELRDHH